VGFWEGKLSPADRLEASKAIIHQLKQKFNISSTALDEWYRVSNKDLGVKAQNALKKLGGLRRLLAQTYPHHPWKWSLAATKSKLNSTTKSNQRAWLAHIRRLFKPKCAAHSVLRIQNSA